MIHAPLTTVKQEREEYRDNKHITFFMKKSQKDIENFNVLFDVFEDDT